MNFKIFLILTVIILAVIFITQNVTVIEVNLFFWRISISSALLIFADLLIGFLLGWFIKSYANYKKAKNAGLADKEIKKPEPGDSALKG